MARTTENAEMSSTWFRFSKRARFHDRPGFPVLRRWFPVDMRILELAKREEDAGAILVLYSHTWEPSPFDSSAVPYLNHHLLIRRDIRIPSFLPSWFGSDDEHRQRTHQKSSVLYVSRFPA